MSGFSIFNWNIGNPSKERAKRQALCLTERPEDLFVLTEVKKSEGCYFLQSYFQSKGYSVKYPKPKENNYGVMIIGRNNFKDHSTAERVEYLSSRISSIKTKGLKITGVYVPSRGSDTNEKKERKIKFIEEIYNTLEKEELNNFIFCGDLNVIPPDHSPSYKQFQTWEYDFYTKLKEEYNLEDAFRKLHPNKKDYSWFGRTGNGYRYDHCLVSSDLLEKLKKCNYYHEPRKEKLSDHSALIVEFDR